MKKWYQWLVLALIFAVGGAVNYFNAKNIAGSIIQVSIVTILAFVQLFCDRKGEKGKKAFRYISITVTVLLFVWLLFLVFRAFT